MRESMELAEYLKQKVVPPKEDSKLSDHPEYSFLLEARDRLYKKRMTEIYRQILGKKK